MGTNAYAYAYDPIGDQKSAKPKAQPPGDRDFEAVRMHGARSGIPRRSGNCNRMQSAVAVGSGPSDETAYLSNPLNQYTNVLYGQSLVVAPAYDPDGSMLTNGPWAYTWDAENRMASACSNGVLLVTNAYDHQSRRIRKEVRVRETPSFEFQVSRSHTFLYDGWNVIRETVAVGSGSTQSVATNYYTWGTDLSGTQQGAGGVGGLLAVTRGDGSVHYPLYDANGNITTYVDAQGDIAASREFDAFGNTVSQSGPPACGFSYWFSTKYLDIETRLYYYGYRFYHPELGRWVSRDPIGERGGLNLLAFTMNKTINAIDLFGLTNEHPDFPVQDPYWGHGGDFERPPFKQPFPQNGFAVIGTDNRVGGSVGKTLLFLGIDHVDIVYEGKIVYVGAGGGTERWYPKYLFVNNVWPLNKSRFGKLKYGTNDKCLKCKDASDSDILECLRSRKPNFSMNCHGDLQSAEKDCCLKGFRSGTSTLAPYWN